LFGVIPIYAIAIIIGVCGAAFIAQFTSLNQKPKFHWILSYLGFVVSVVWIYTIANEIVNLLTVKELLLKKIFIHLKFQPLFVTIRHLALL
jgi:amino acid permease